MRVLVVEDNLGDFDLIREALETAEPPIEFAHSERLSEARQHLQSSEFDAVILDLELPDSRGLATVSGIVAAAPGIPILVLTITDDDTTGLQALRAGAHDYLFKQQVGRSALMRSVRYAIERKRLHDKLTETAKLNAVATLSAGVAHTFNNLLTIIVGHTGLLKDELAVSKNARALEDIAGIEDAAGRAAALISYLLAFSKQQMLLPRVVDLNEIVLHTTQMLRPIFEAVTISTSLAPDLEPVLADPGALEQVLVSLLTNAREALPQGGHITVTTFNEWRSAAENHRSRTLYSALRVTDTGAGITPAVQERMFEPFFTTKPPGTAVGLGLSMVRGTALQSGGLVDVSSQPGHGTSVTVLLPAAARAGEVVNSRAVLESILLVEDEPAVSRVTRKMLEHAGYQVLETHSPIQALSLAERHNGPIHLLLADLVMPEMSGTELAQRLVAIRSQMKVLFMSAYTEASKNGTELAAAFVAKPFTAATLIAKIREQLHGNTANSQAVPQKT